MSVNNEKLVSEAKKWLQDLMKEDFDTMTVEEVAEKYDLNKTDRVAIPKGEFDGKFSKVVEILELKGLSLQWSANDSMEDNQENPSPVDSVSVDVEMLKELSDTKAALLEASKKVDDLTKKVDELATENATLKTRNQTPQAKKDAPKKRTWGNSAGIYNGNVYGESNW